MLATDATGLASSAAVITAAALLVTTRAPGLTPGRRALVLGGVAALALVPIGALSLAGYLRGLTGDLSITTLVLLLRAIGKQLVGSGPVEERDQVALQALLAGAGLALYPLALGLGAFDPYRLGYAGPWLMSALLLVTLAAWLLRLSLAAWCMALAVLAYAVGWYESNNLWDYLVDPLVALYSLSALVVRATRRRGATQMQGVTLPKMRLLIGLMLMGGTLSAQQAPPIDEPRFTSDGQLLRPDNYREWIFLTSGLGMTYGPVAAATAASNPQFDNVFVTPRAYRAFLESGAWPDKTLFALEVRSAASKGSINKGGHFQEGMVDLEVHVKDTSRFPNKWAFVAFGASAPKAKPLEPNSSCQECHSKNGAVDETFVQFYPTLIPVAKANGTFKARE